MSLVFKIFATLCVIAIILIILGLMFELTDFGEFCLWLAGCIWGVVVVVGLVIILYLVWTGDSLKLLL